MRRLLVALVLVGAAFAGCVGDEPVDPVDVAGDDTPPATTTPGPAQPAPGNGTRPETQPGPTPPATNGSSPSQPPASGPPEPPAPSGPARVWPPVEEAPVRPGVQVFYGNSQCTSNFVYASPDNATLYLGVAAHCFRGAALGDAVDIGRGVASGTLAYSSWITMGSDGGNELTGADAVCSIEKDETVCDTNDFALVRIDRDSEALVHPAMLHFGGPTALAPSAGVTIGEKVLTYGNSGTRMGLDPTNRHEGIVLEQWHAWSTTIYTAAPGVPGDSGSGVLLGDGRALGVLVTVYFTPTPAANGVTSLDLALQYAREKGGVDARLATWELLTPGVVPVR